MDKKRYEYKFVRVKISSGFLGIGFSTDYQGVIEQHAREGWRFVQAYAPALSNNGKCDLIFEMEVR